VYNVFQSLQVSRNPTMKMRLKFCIFPARKAAFCDHADFFAQLFIFLFLIAWLMNTDNYYKLITFALMTFGPEAECTEENCYCWENEWTSTEAETRRSYCPFSFSPAFGLNRHCCCRINYAAIWSTNIKTQAGPVESSKEESTTSH